MQIRLFVMILLLFWFGKSNSQTYDSSPVVISHIFFCIDSASYNNLLKHEFIANRFSVARESSSKTTTDSWTGTYLMGRHSYVEVFSSNSAINKPQLGDKFGDVGLVFRTRKPGTIHKLDRLLKSSKRDAKLKEIEFEYQGKKVLFNYNLYLSNSKLEETFRPYIEEFPVGFLKLCGFNDVEIQSGVTENQFREKRSGKKYEKLYDNIEKIELNLTGEEFNYLAETLKFVGFSQTGYQFFNDQIVIRCFIQPHRKYKLRSIHFSLSEQSEVVNIKISKNMTFHANGRKAFFEFNHN